jgi:DNA primase catalytic subunit
MKTIIACIVLLGSIGCQSELDRCKDIADNEGLIGVFADKGCRIALKKEQDRQKAIELAQRKVKDENFAKCLEQNKDLFQRTYDGNKYDSVQSFLTVCGSDYTEDEKNTLKLEYLAQHGIE